VAKSERGIRTVRSTLTRFDIFEALVIFVSQQQLQPEVQHSQEACRQRRGLFYSSRFVFCELNLENTVYIYISYITFLPTSDAGVHTSGYIVSRVAPAVLLLNRALELFLL